MTLTATVIVEVFLHSVCNSVNFILNLPPRFNRLYQHVDIRLALQIMMEYSIAGFGGLDIGVIYTLTINYLLPVMVSCMEPIPILMTMKCGSLF